MPISAQLSCFRSLSVNFSFHYAHLYTAFLLSISVCQFLLPLCPSLLTFLAFDLSLCLSCFLLFSLTQRRAKHTLHTIIIRFDSAFFQKSLSFPTSSAFSLSHAHFWNSYKYFVCPLSSVQIAVAQHKPECPHSLGQCTPNGWTRQQRQAIATTCVLCGRRESALLSRQAAISATGWRINYRQQLYVALQYQLHTRLLVTIIWSVVASDPLVVAYLVLAEIWASTGANLYFLLFLHFDVIKLRWCATANRPIGAYYTSELI